MTIDPRAAVSRALLYLRIHLYCSTPLKKLVGRFRVSTAQTSVRHKLTSDRKRIRLFRTSRSFPTAARVSALHGMWIFEKDTSYIVRGLLGMSGRTTCDATRLRGSCAKNVGGLRFGHSRSLVDSEAPEHGGLIPGGVEGHGSVSVPPPPRDLLHLATFGVCRYTISPLRHQPIIGLHSLNNSYIAILHTNTPCQMRRSKSNNLGTRNIPPNRDQYARKSNPSHGMF